MSLSNQKSEIVVDKASPLGGIFDIKGKLQILKPGEIISKDTNPLIPVDPIGEAIEGIPLNADGSAITNLETKIENILSTKHSIEENTSN